MDVGETLYTNLLMIERRPEKVWIAPVLPQKQFGFHDRLSGMTPPYVYKGGLIHTLSDPSDGETAFAGVIDAGGVEEVDLEDWIAQGTEYEVDLARLMNSLIHQHLRGIGLSYEKRPRRYFYNRGLAVDAPIQKRWTSARTNRTQPRTVAKHYEYGKLKFFRHQALDYGFERFGDLWAIAIHPQLMFTTDGKRPWEGEAARSYAISARVEEYNDAYLNNILFWAHQMAGGHDRFRLKIGDQAVAAASGIPLTAEAAFSIQSNPVPVRKRPKGSEMSVTIEYIREPRLEFGGHFFHPDKKTGLAETGAFGRTDPAIHPTQIRVGIVGTRATAELCERWVDECRHYIETTKTQSRTVPAGSPSLPEEIDEEVIVEALVKSFPPDFVGMSAESSFATSILTAERWRATFQDREARLIADGDNPIQRVERATDLIAEHIERIATVSPAPDVILVAMPEVLLENSSTA